MKKPAVIIIIFIFSLLFSGCTSSVDETLKVDVNENDQSVNKVISEETTAYAEIIDDSSYPEMKAFIEDKKQYRGYDYFVNTDGEIILVIFSGEKSSAGYDVEVISVEKDQDSASIIVKETAPPKGSLNAAVLTYPYKVVKFSQLPAKFIIKNTDGEVFQSLR